MRVTFSNASMVRSVECETFHCVLMIEELRGHILVVIVATNLLQIHHLQNSRNWKNGFRGNRSEYYEDLLNKHGDTLGERNRSVTLFYKRLTGSA